MGPSTGSRPTRASGRSAIAPANGSSSATIRCSSASGWDPISSTTARRNVTMDARLEARRTALLAEIARDASLERSDFLVRSGEQLARFMSVNRDRVRELGGLTLIDDDPDYLAIAPDGSFRSRARVWDESKN